MSSSRAGVAAIIGPSLPGWRIVTATVKSVGTLAAPTAFIDYTEISHEGMPAGQLLDAYEVALLSDLTDFEKAENYLDPIARALVRALDPRDDIAWSTAQKRKVGDYLAWIITVQMVSPATEE